MGRGCERSFAIAMGARHSDRTQGQSAAARAPGRLRDGETAVSCPASALPVDHSGTARARPKPGARRPIWSTTTAATRQIAPAVTQAGVYVGCEERNRPAARAPAPGPIWCGGAYPPYAFGAVPTAH